MEKNDRRHLTQMIQLKTTNVGTSQDHPPPDIPWEGQNTTYETLLPKKLTHWDHQINPHWRTFFKPAGLASWKREKSSKTVQIEGG